MANVNKVHLLGRITQDIEVRYTHKGTAVTSLNLAINRVRKGENDDRIEETTFVEVTLWGRSAELAGQYLGKGREVYIEGRLDLQTWDDKQTGQKRSKLRVVGENMQFIGNGEGSKQTSFKGQENGPPRGEKYEAANRAYQAQNPATQDVDEDDICLLYTSPSPRD